MTALAACALITGSLALRWVDASTASEPIAERGLPSMGVYANAGHMGSLFSLAPGIADWPDSWTLRATPGDPWTGTLSWIGLSSEGYAQLNLKEPVPVLIALPDGARLTNKDPVRVGFPEACATWWDGKAIGSQEPVVTQSANFPGVFVGCEIPAVGVVDDLFIEVEFEWPSHARGHAGFGRTRDAISFPLLPEWVPSDAQPSLPPAVDQLQYASVRQPLEFRLQLPEGQRLIEAFPPPSGGALQERSWRMEPSGDIEVELLVESARERVWVQPATETLLLLGGVLLGLLPLVWQWESRSPSAK